MDQIFIEDFKVYGVIGVNEWERQKPQEILISLYISTDLRFAGQSDNLADTIDYSMVAKGMKNLVEQTQHLTLEALAADIASYILAIHRVQGVRVRVVKPGAIKYSHSVGVEIERLNETHPTAKD